jgi:hypothetical protein
LKDPGVSLFWWGKHLIMGLLALFFLLFGVDTLVTAYKLKNPAEFILFFFSSNLIILISAVGLLFPLVRIYHRLKSPDQPPTKGNGYE